MATTAVFMSGNSQAVRLPKAFRFSGTSVEIFRRGNEVVLRERQQTLAQALGDWPAIAADEGQAWQQLLAEASTAPAQERDWADLLGADQAP